MKTANLKVFDRERRPIGQVQVTDEQVRRAQAWVGEEKKPGFFWKTWFLADLVLR